MQYLRLAITLLLVSTFVFSNSQTILHISQEGSKSSNTELNKVRNITFSDSGEVLIAMNSGKDQSFLLNSIQAFSFDKVQTITSSNFAAKNHIYPNPVRQTLYIEIPQNENNDISIYIFNINGKLVYSKKTQTASKQNIDVSLLQSGVYICKIVGKKSSTSTKFLKH